MIRGDSCVTSRDRTRKQALQSLKEEAAAWTECRDKHGKYCERDNDDDMMREMSKKMEQEWHEKRRTLLFPCLSFLMMMILVMIVTKETTWVKKTTRDSFSVRRMWGEERSHSHTNFGALSLLLVFSQSFRRFLQSLHDFLLLILTLMIMAFVRESFVEKISSLFSSCPFHVREKMSLERERE